MRDSDDNTRVTGQGPWARARVMQTETNEVLATGASWSGHERNHLFFGGLPGYQFERMSGVSGLDDPGDSRAFATIDYDRDGWLDVVLGNVSAPRTRLLRNEIGRRGPARGNGFVALRFVGGNVTPGPVEGWSPRDGLGARVTVNFGTAGRIYREHRIDDGFKAQNSGTMIIGIGRLHTAESIEVRWPSSRTQAIADVPSGTLLTVYENTSASPTGEAFVGEPYRREPPIVDGTSDWKQGFLPVEPSTSTVKLQGVATDAGLVMYLGIATWCTACVAEIPELRALRSVMGADELAMIGVPFDRRESPTKVRRWMTRHDPPYKLADITSAELDAFTAVVKTELWQTGRLPLSIVTDADGNVLLARWGIPTVSELRALQWAG